MEFRMWQRDFEALMAFDRPSLCPQQVVTEGPWTSGLLQDDHPLDRWFWNDPVPHFPSTQSCFWHSEGLLACCTPDSPTLKEAAGMLLGHGGQGSTLGQRRGYIFQPHSSGSN